MSHINYHDNLLPSPNPPLNFFLKQPLLISTLGYLAGLLLGPGSAQSLPFMILALPLLALGFIFFLRGRSRIWQAVSFFLLLAIAVLAGRLMTVYEQEKLLSSDTLEPFVEQGVLRMDARLIEPPEEREKSSVLWVEAERIFQHDKLYPVSGKVRLTVGTLEVTARRGDRVRMPVSLSYPKSFHNPGGFDYCAYLAHRGVLITGYVESADQILLLGPRVRLSLLALVDRLRERIGRAVNPEKDSGRALIAALVIGYRQVLDRGVDQAFQDTGLAHLLAISGEQLSLVAFLAYLLLRVLWSGSEWLSLRVPVPRAAAALVMGPVVFYTFLVGLQVSTVRAMIMVLTYLVAVLFGRSRNLWNAWLLALLVILLIWPSALYDAALILSFAAVGALIYMLPRIWLIFPRSALFDDNDKLADTSVLLPPWWAGNVLRGKIFEYSVNLLIMSVIVQYSLAPIQAYYFNRFTPLSPLFNFVAIPITDLFLIPAGLVAAMVSLASPGLGSLLYALLDYPSRWLILLVNWFAGWPLAAVLFRQPTLLEIIAWYGLCFSVVEIVLLIRNKEPSWVSLMKKPEWLLGRGGIIAAAALKRQRYLPYGFASSCLIFFALLIGPALYTKLHTPHHRLALTVIDVGQGLSQLVEFPDGKAMLVDGGGFASESFDVGQGVVAPLLLRLGHRGLDAVVLSHPHPDHANGLKYILQKFKVNELWVTKDRNDIMEAILAIADQRGIPVRTLSRETGNLSLGHNSIEVLHPPSDASGQDKTLNERSLVLRVSYGDYAFLLPGDIGGDVEDELIANYGPEGQIAPEHLKAQVFVAPHHGSRGSSSAGFIEAVQPEVVIFSARYSRFIRMPAPEVLKRYKKRGINILRTDEDGMVRVECDGRGMEISKQ